MCINDGIDVDSVQWLFKVEFNSPQSTLIIGARSSPDEVVSLVSVSQEGGQVNRCSHLVHFQYGKPQATSLTSLGAWARHALTAVVPFSGRPPSCRGLHTIASRVNPPAAAISPEDIIQNRAQKHPINH